MPHEPDVASSLALVAVCHRLASRGFVAATDGNVSLRLDDGDILVTPSGMNKGRVSDADLVRVTKDGKRTWGTRPPTTELGMHLFIYAQRPDIRAIVHAHPVHATAFAAARLPLTGAVFPEVIIGLGAVPLVPYATPSTDEVRQAIAPVLEECDAFLLANHGAVTMGHSLDEALFRMEKVEHAAHTIAVARALGGERLLSADDLQKLRKVSRKNYGRDLGPLTFLDVEK